MLSKVITRFTNTEEKKRLLSNFFSLSVLQVANYIFPLITLPYLVRVLEPEKFGLIAFAQAFIGYFHILTNYGFNFSATREISINRENLQKISEIFSSVIIVQFLLVVLSFIIMMIIVFSFNKFKTDWLVYVFTFGTVVGNVLFSVWFFQGIERMKYITILNVLARGIFTIGIFLFIRKQSDYLFVPLISSLGSILAGVLALRIVFKNFNITFILPSIENIKHSLKEGWHIFISTIAISLYTTSNTFILGLFASNTIVGYYSAAERVIKAFQGLLVPVSQSVYPYISKMVQNSRETAIVFIRKLIFLIGGVSFVFSILIFIFAPFIVNIVFGSQYAPSTIVLKILSFLLFIIALSNIFGIQTMLPFEYKKALSTILIIASLINILFSFILVPLYYEVGTSIAVLITEIFVTTSMFLFLNSKGVKILEAKIV